MEATTLSSTCLHPRASTLARDVFNVEENELITIKDSNMLKDYGTLFRDMTSFLATEECADMHHILAEKLLKIENLLFDPYIALAMVEDKERDADGNALQLNQYLMECAFIDPKDTTCYVCAEEPCLINVINDTMKEKFFVTRDVRSGLAKVLKTIDRDEDGLYRITYPEKMNHLMDFCGTVWLPKELHSDTCIESFHGVATVQLVKARMQSVSVYHFPYYMHPHMKLYSKEPVHFEVNFGPEKDEFHIAYVPIWLVRILSDLMIRVNMYQATLRASRRKRRGVLRMNYLTFDLPVNLLELSKTLDDVNLKKFFRVTMGFFYGIALNGGLPTELCHNLSGASGELAWSRILRYLSKKETFNLFLNNYDDIVNSFRPLITAKGKYLMEKQGVPYTMFQSVLNRVNGRCRLCGRSLMQEHILYCGKPKETDLDFEYSEKAEC